MIRVLFGAGTAAAANGITADIDVLLDAGGAGSAGNGFTVNLTLDEGSTTIELMPLSVDLAITGIAPLVSTGVSINPPVAAYSIAGLAPAVRSVLAVRVSLGEFELAAAAPTVATGASVSPAALALGISAVAPEAVGPPTGDPDFASVSLLLPMDGTDGSTTFTDASSNARTITTFGAAQISTAESKFGGASAIFNGTDAYLGHTAITFTGPYTLEAWVRVATYPDTDIAGGTNTSDNPRWRIRGDGKLAFSPPASTGGIYIESQNPVPLNEFVHVRFCRDSDNKCYLFINGNGEYGVTGPTMTASGNHPYSRIGWGGLTVFDAPAALFTGYIDEVRYTDICRSVTGFTPPTEPFPTS
jgi:hypothetical protein